MGSSGAYSHSKSDQIYKFEEEKKTCEWTLLFSEFGKWKEVTISLEFRHWFPSYARSKQHMELI